MNTTNSKGCEYDIIFAGGGTAACIVAGRLAEADPSLSILIIERGRNNLNDPTIVIPGVFPTHITPDSQTVIFYKTEKEAALNGRELTIPSGGILGGGSSINSLMYTRAQGVDYDSWKTEGWDAKSLLPFANKLETYHVDHPSINKSRHGYHGPIHVSFGTYGPKGPQDDWFEAAKAMGDEEIVDLQDFDTIGGFSRWARYVSPDGRRQDTAHCYIHPLISSGKYPNLHLQLESKVSRIVFQGKRAIGVEYEPSAIAESVINLSTRVHTFVKARKLVVVSAGALATPSILERSGVGSKDLLDKLGIPVISDLPGVGENYMDHGLIIYPYKTSLKPEDTIDELRSGRKAPAEAVEKDPMLGWNAIDISAKLRPTEQEIDALGNNFREHWDRDFKDIPTKPLMLMAVCSGFLGDHSVLAEYGPAQYAGLGPYTAYTYARGSIHIVTKDSQTPASFVTGFLKNQVDVQMLIWGYKKSREIYRRTNAYQGEVPIGHPKFPEDSKAVISDGPAVSGGFKTFEERLNLPPLVYSQEDDKCIEDFIRSNLETNWHSIGTCKMAPREDGGVVDKYLNVYGTQGLKVADLSIPPENVGANTANTALIIGEKAADIIIKELRLIE